MYPECEDLALGIKVPSVNIRPMEPADLETVAGIERECYPSPWTRERFRQELENSMATIDVAWSEEAIAGYLCAWQIGDELEIHNVATVPRFRRRGVGRALLDHALGRSAAQGGKRAFLEVREDNLPARKLYQEAGFRYSGRRFRYYPDGEDALLMKCRLDEGWKPSVGDVIYRDP